MALWEVIQREKVAVNTLYTFDVNDAATPAEKASGDMPANIFEEITTIALEAHSENGTVVFIEKD